MRSLVPSFPLGNKSEKQNLLPNLTLVAAKMDVMLMAVLLTLWTEGSGQSEPKEYCIIGAGPGGTWFNSLAYQLTGSRQRLAVKSVRR